MTRLLIGVSMVCLIVWLLAARVATHDLRILVNLVLLPASIFWLVGESIHLTRPCRLFQGRRRATAFLIGYGAAIGVLGHGIAAVVMAFAGPVTEVVVVPGSFALVAIAAMLALPRRRPNHCVYCRHDLRGQRHGSAQCTECGGDRLQAA